jgi:hypothetical protein
MRFSRDTAADRTKKQIAYNSQQILRKEQNNERRKHEKTNHLPGRQDETATLRKNCTKDDTEGAGTRRLPGRRTSSKTTSCTDVDTNRAASWLCIPTLHTYYNKHQKNKNNTATATEVK